MLIFADERIPGAALDKLSEFGEVVPFATQNITYASISCHPDIFICPVGDVVITAPGTPEEYVERIRKSGKKVIAGLHRVGRAYPESARYNAFVNAQYLIHNQAITDPMIVQHTTGLTRLNVKQGYTRCNLIEAGGLYITSDRAIDQILLRHHAEVLYVDPAQIVLPGEKHGFFGGCAGFFDNKLLLTGSCPHFREGKLLREMLQKRGVTLVELHDGPLFDGGSIICI